MPDSIASVLGFVAASRAIGAYQTISAMEAEPNEKPKQNQDTQSEENTQNTFSFGSFIGTDGKAHFGVELSTHVEREKEGLYFAKLMEELDGCKVTEQTLPDIRAHTPLHAFAGEDVLVDLSEA